MKTIAIVIFDNFTDIDAFFAWDLFNRLTSFDPGWKVQFAGTKESHTSVYGIEVKTHMHVRECSEATVVFFASGPGTRQLYQNKAYLQEFALRKEDQIICSMCSGALLLAGLGLLVGKTATTYPTAMEELRATGVEVVEDRSLVTHDRIATAAGCLAAVDLVSWCLDKIVGPEVRANVIRSVLPVGQESLA